MLKLVARLTAWNLLPNAPRDVLQPVGRPQAAPRPLPGQVRDDLGRVLALIASGAISARVDARFPLTEAAAALRRAEAGGIGEGRARAERLSYA